MLDSETRTRIESARDILVGKVPDPKSQVEQITIALIYKFMDDMDRQSEELGGKTSFFRGKFKRYAWPNLLDKRLSGHERLLLYAEGIIFQSQNAYKALRKMLVEDYLWAVVSLPAGVFNPYSGVKTSILLMDRNLAKRKDEILFVKIENDGLDRGAQRRPVEGSQLAEAQKCLLQWKKGHKNAQKAQGTLVHAVSRKRILESPDLNLSGERYRDRGTAVNGKWSMVPIGEMCQLTNGRAFKRTDWEKEDSGGLPIIRIQNLNNPSAIFNYYSKPVADKLIVSRGDLLFSWSGSRGTSFGPHIWNRENGILNQHIFKVEHPTKVLRGYLYLALKKAVAEVEENLHGGVGLVHITKGNLERILIPLPPLDVQEKIVAELDGYSSIAPPREERPRDMSIYTSPHAIGEHWMLQKRVRARVP